MRSVRSGQTNTNASSAVSAIAVLSLRSAATRDFDINASQRYTPPLGIHTKGGRTL